MPFNPFDFLNKNSDSLHNDFERYQGFFDQFFGGNFLSKELLDQWMNKSGVTQNQGTKETNTNRGDREIPVDLYQRQHDLLLVFEIPGLNSEKDVQLKIVGQTLVVEGEVNRSYVLEGEVVKSERKMGKFSRKVVLPITFDNKKIHARYQNGLLEVRIPTIKSTQQEKIAIRFTDQ
ncbi:Hsp20/alpha crystallin family protein [Tepidibacillus marianensis]|uniref:Hsp20/alpha crystallin family protein n=1 Tax=Tepidibacillus marianensis TaxID=3131995 RepID=UPI0030D0FC47